MRRNRLVAGLTAMVALIAAVVVGSAAADAATATSSYVVTFTSFDNGPDRAIAEKRAPAAGVRGVYRKLLPAMTVDLTPDEAAALAKDPTVLRVEPNVTMKVADTRSTSQWGLDRSDQRALPLTKTYVYRTSAGVGTYVYVVDSGIRATHGELVGRVGAGYTTVADGRGTGDCTGHGTHVAGIAAGKTYGMASRATVVPVRIVDCTGTTSVASMVAGLDAIAGDTTRRPAVVNISIGGGYNATVNDALARLVASGVTVVVAAGNSALDACSSSPASAASAITVAATTSTDTRASYSNYGTCVDLFAPGDLIVSAGITSDTATITKSGTSMASPHVAGAAAILLADNRTLTPAQVTTQLVNDATVGKVLSAGTGSPNRLLYSDPAQPASNNGFSTPTLLTVSGTGSVAGTTAWATKELGEPAHAGNAGGRSIWYTFKPSTKVKVTLSTDGSGIDTLLGVYTGTAVGSLTAVASNNDAAIGSTWSSVTFVATAGISYRVAVDVANGAAGPVTLRWSVAAPVAVATTSLPGAVRGSTYSVQLAQSGGRAAYSWRLTSGVLPAGLTLSSAGLLSGTPTVAGTVTATFAVTDGATTGTRSLSLSVTAPAVLDVATTALPAATKGVAYTTRVAATGGTAPYRFSLVSGALPAGLALAADGTISGTPTVAGTSAFTVHTADAVGAVATRSLSLVVADPAMTVPAAFGKLTPTSGATGVSRTAATFTWAAAAGAASYELCVSLKSGSCTTWIPAGTATTATVGGLLSKTTYYWQVRAINAKGLTVANGGTWWKLVTAI